MTSPRVRTVATGVGAAAALIAVLTLLARLAGLGRNLVFARTVGTTCIGDTYVAANTVPNIIFEIVAGGALASLVVPMISGAIASGDHERARRTASSLLTWTILILLPICGLVALLARPLAEALLSGSSCSEAVELGARMLLVFAPQVVLYGIGIVLTGILQAHGRFAGPAVAPLLSSLVVAVAYLLYRLSAGVPDSIAGLDRGSELILSVGTTIGVVVLALVLLIPLRRTGLRLRPSLGFPAGVAPRVRRLAAAGISTLAAQQIAVVVAIRLANDGAPPGTQVLYLLAMTVFLLPWAAVAVPLATSAFPRLSASWERGDEGTYRKTLAPTTAAVLIGCLLGSAAMFAVAEPAARIFVQGTGVPESDLAVGRLADAIVAFAPGLMGYGLVALLTRALYARGLWKEPTLAVVGGWLVTVTADIGLAATLPAASRGLALAAGHSVGVTVAGIALILMTVRHAGRDSLDGLTTVGAAAVVAILVAAGAGRLLADAWDGGGVILAVLQVMAAGTVVLLTAGATMMVLARKPTLAVLHGLRRHDPVQEDAP
ncbi:MAG: MATE family efflux transporter [Actinomycetota bacterium]|nr:MATE family efflux transporter [Actinomycetota bacterium]